MVNLILIWSRHSLQSLVEGRDVMRLRFHEFAKQPKKSTCLQVVRSESQRKAINRKDAKCNFNIVNINDQRRSKMENDIRDMIIGMIDDGSLSARATAIMCVKYMSCDDLSDMLHANEVQDEHRLDNYMDRNFK